MCIFQNVCAVTSSDFFAYCMHSSFITGFSLSADDRTEFPGLPYIPSFATYPNTHRWASHIVALTGQFYHVDDIAPGHGTTTEERRETARVTMEENGVESMAVEKALDVGTDQKNVRVVVMDTEPEDLAGAR
jgi:hypothetical protein